MEEAWEDINLPPLNDHHQSPATVISTLNNNNPTSSSITFQDFLATTPPPNNNKMPPITSSDCVPNAEETNFFGSVVPTSSITLLSLNSGSDLLSMGSDKQNPVASATPCFGSCAVSPCFSKKMGEGNKENCEDRRHKRKMKNRESAARSRARKQAYTNELEFEVAHLLEENANLRKQQEKILAEPYQVPKKNRPSRTLTAPF